ncbi:MAG: hypothetical protein CBC09_01745 [Cellvibrionales bacterium TMED49]|nr:hypothetical protein [Porticoccaceae bacterium]OUU39587.1 MAG: hypothetical protein CBC09_01745 [Cellvibrionales bacterium TMED49]
MRGRGHACGVALVGYLLPLVSQATVGLVSLRKGFLEGSVVALWASLPIILSWFAGSFDEPNANRLLVLVTTSTLFITVVGAQILRITSSWQWTICGVVFFSMVAVLGLSEWFSEGVDELINSFIIWVPDTYQIVSEPLERQKLWLVSGLTTFSIFSTVICLLISRWWQSQLYNPGGFRQEFHNLRLNNRLMQGLVLSAILGLIFIRDSFMLVQLLLVPLLISGIALVHWTVQEMRLSSGCLIIMYIALLMFSPIFPLMIACLGALDSQFCLRLKLETNFEQPKNK